MRKELKNKEVCSQKPLPFAFHPKATNYGHRQVFWLVRFLTAFPSHQGQWRVVVRTFYRTHSYGDSSRFSRDSLLILYLRIMEAGTCNISPTKE